MEVVHVFNKELKSILEAKLPVSRHKMSLITKSAMKALKFYKHVVQSVEKFITKCNCEYKVPGLYVIDAIVRQSKHQYCDKDVFVPRFMRNIVTTFIHLSQCDPKDIMSIERVLRLWQQNGVFPTDLVEALLELVYDPSNSNKVMNASNIVLKLVNDWNILKGKPEEKLDIFMPHTDSGVISNETIKTEGGLIESITKLLTKFQAETGQDVTTEISQIQFLHQKIVQQSALLAQGEMIDADTLSQLHQSMEELTKKAAKAAAVQQSKLAMLATEEKDHMNDASTDLEFVEQLQQMVDTLGQTRALQEELKHALEIQQNTTNDDEEEDAIVEVTEADKDFRELEEGEEHYQMENNVDVDLRMININSLPESYTNHSDHDSVNNKSSDKMSRTSSMGSRKRTHSSSEVGFNKRKIPQPKERKRKEKKNRITRKRWMPMLRDQFVGIISHTMFIGHLHKHVSESKLKTICEEFGSIAEFNMIPPRGCAFVTFDKRKGAYKAIAKMNDLKFEGRDLKVAWAPNKGVKDEKEFRDYWVESEGCTYIPMEQFPINRSTELSDGSAELDEDSLTEELKQAIYQFEQQKSDALSRGLALSSVETMISVAAEVVNQKIPLINPGDNVIDKSAQYFNQFSIPPPMLHPAIIPYPPPPPPHIFMGAPIPPMPMRPELSLPNPMMSNNNYMDYQGLASTLESGLPGSGVGGPSFVDTLVGMTQPPPPPASVPYSPRIIVRHTNTDHNHHRARHTRPPFFRGAQFHAGGAGISRGRFPRPTARFPRPPPPGFPVLRPSMVSRPPAPPRF